MPSGVTVFTCDSQPSGGGGGAKEQELEISLGYMVSPRLAWAT